MGDFFLYADETGNLDYDVSEGSGASQYFGFGTAVFDHEHGPELWAGMRLRAQLSQRFELPKGFHAKNDSIAVRADVYSEVQSQAPRFDATLLKKANAYSYVKAKGPLYIYKYAWFRHLIRIAPQIVTKDDTLYVIVASLGTARLQKIARAALENVCQQTGLDVRLCVWNSATSWGLQVADYGLWAIQRSVERNDDSWFKRYIEPTTQTIVYPWRQ